MWSAIAAFALRKLPFLTAWWVKPACYALVAAGLMWAGWHAHSIADAAARAKELQSALYKQQALYAEQHASDIKQHASDTKLLADAAVERDAISSQRDDLLIATQNKPLIKYISKVVHDETGDHTCPIATRDTSFRLCYNAALSGSAAARAACKANE